MIVKLQSAEVDEGINDGGIVATVDLEWEAVGDVCTEVFLLEGMRAAHRTTEASVAGTVTIAGYDPFNLPTAGIITYYNTIVSDNLPWVR